MTKSFVSWGMFWLFWAVCLVTAIAGCEVDGPEVHDKSNPGSSEDTRHCDFILDWESRQVCRATVVNNGTLDGGAVD